MTPTRMGWLLGAAFVACGCHGRQFVRFVNDSSHPVEARIVGRETTDWERFPAAARGDLASVYDPTQYRVEVKSTSGTARLRISASDEVGGEYVVVYGGEKDRP